MNVHGIGLGLVISKHIVEAFGGKIQVTSEYGVGSNFTFTFKLNSQTNTSLELSNKKKKFDIDNPKLHFYWRQNDSIIPNINTIRHNINYTLNLDKIVKQDMVLSNDINDQKYWGWEKKNLIKDKVKKKYNS